MEHLLEAAVHLEAAGETQRGQQIRQLVAKERQTVLSRLDKQKSGTDGRQVQIHFRAMEVSVSRLKELGLEWKHVTPNGVETVSLGNEFPAFGTLPVLDDNTALLAIIEPLRKHGLVRMLAEPTMIATSGRPATFQSGGRVAQTKADGHQELVEVGTRIDLVPHVIEPDRVHLELKIAITEPELQLSKPFVRSVDTRVEMKTGQTFVISGLRTHSKARDETIETVILITSEIVEAPLTTQVAPAATAVK